MGSVWWYVARASGVVAWGLAALSVLWGLFLSTKLFGRSVRPNWLLDLHRFLGGLTVAFVGVHLVGLYLDPWVTFHAKQLFVPFASSWSPVAVAWGIVAMYLLVAVEISSLARRRIPTRWWRGIHFASYAVYVLGTVHLLTAGTDRHAAALVWSVVAVSLAIAALTLYRVSQSGTDRRETPGTTSGTIRSTQPIG